MQPAQQPPESAGTGPSAGGRWSEGMDGQHPSYVERLWPGPLSWGAALGFVAALSIAYAAAVGTAAGLLMLALSGALALAVLLGWSPMVRVDDRVLRAGRARLPLGCCGRVIALDATATKLARGPEGDPTAHVLTRPGVGPGSVLVEVRDPADPHGTWLVASRHPERLAAALATAVGALGSGGAAGSGGPDGA